MFHNRFSSCILDGTPACRQAGKPVVLPLDDPRKLKNSNILLFLYTFVNVE